MILDSFILTFKDNSEPCIIINCGKIVPAQWLYDLSKGTAKYVGKTRGEIEVSIPINIFLEIKDKAHFQSKCSTLVRLRTTPRTLLSVLCWPINPIDNNIYDRA